MAVEPRDGEAAQRWGSGAADYDRLREAQADSIEHLLVRLAVRPGERALDMATGTGWTARRMAQVGARVTGLDIAPAMVGEARRLTAQAGLDIDFLVGDAEGCGLPSGAFDVIASTFGVAFARRPEAAAAELARLCRPGGRIGLTAWPPGGAFAAMLAVVRPHMPPPPDPAPPSPLEWARPERVRELLGAHFDLGFETGTSVLRMPSAEAAWEAYSRGAGPVKAALSHTARKDDLRRDFIAFHEAHRTDLGIAVPRDYLVVVGTRR
jgi:SAM-dependent methyltransferase